MPFLVFDAQRKYGKAFYGVPNEVSRISKPRVLWPTRNSISTEKALLVPHEKDEFVCNCSSIDDIIVFFKDGKYKVVKVSDKMFVGKEFCMPMFKRNDKRTIYNGYRDGKTRHTI